MGRVLTRTPMALDTALAMADNGGMMGASPISEYLHRTYSIGKSAVRVLFVEVRGIDSLDFIAGFGLNSDAKLYHEFSELAPINQNYFRV